MFNMLKMHLMVISLQLVGSLAVLWPLKIDYKELLTIKNGSLMIEMNTS